MFEIYGQNLITEDSILFDTEGVTHGLIPGYDVIGAWIVNNFVKFFNEGRTLDRFGFIFF